jgi:cyclohexanone monooxygenase
LRYANHVADRFDLRRDIQFDARVHSATFDEAHNRWVLEIGNAEQVRATYCIMATGCLSSPADCPHDCFRLRRVPTA